MSHQPKSGLRDFKRQFSGRSESNNGTPLDWSSSPTLADIQNTESTFSRHNSGYGSTSTQKSAPPSSSALNSDAARTARYNAIAQALKEQQELESSKKRAASVITDKRTVKKSKSVPWELEEADAEPSQSSRPPQSTKQRSASTGQPAKIFLSKEQKRILTLVQQGKSIFYTGSAGTGKSVLLREIIKALKFKHAKSSDAIAITASTGIAACNIGGMTIHSFAGIGLGNDTPEKLATKVRKNPKAQTRWQRTKVLIIDEISMVDGELFDKLARIASILRKDTKPFGGIQLIVTGDFFQLPPVSAGTPRFAFEADAWQTCIGRTFNLTQVFRQKDSEFVDMLNEMRFGKLSNKSIARFKKLSRDIHYSDGIEPTELFPRRENVEMANNARNKTLRGEAHTYQANDSGKLEAPVLNKLLQNTMYPATLELKIGSQVMLIKNTDDTLVNGSIGKVKAFMTLDAWKTHGGGGGAGNAWDEKENGKPSKMKQKDNDTVYPIVTFGNDRDLGVGRDILVVPESWKSETPTGEIQAQRVQLPLTLSWAMSIHKSQGQTLDRVKVDLRRVFEKGQAYVALSRATSLEGLQVLGFQEDKVMAHPKVIEWCKTLEIIEV